MVTVGETEIDVPVPSRVPPQEPEYQFQVPPVPRDPPVKLSVVGWPSQLGFTLAEALVAATERLFTVTVTLTQPVVLHTPSALT